MLSPRGLSGYGRAYVLAVILFGFGVISISAYELFVLPFGNQWLLLAALTLLTGSATVKLPSVPASISVSEAFVFSAVLLYGPAAGTLIVALDGLVISFWIWTAKRRHEPHRALFNMAAPAASAWCSSHLFYQISGISPLFFEPAPINRILPAMVVFAITYFLINSALITFAVSMETPIKPLKIWKDNFVWLSLNYFFGASVAVFFVSYTREVDVRYVGVLVPLLLVLYFTFKLSIDRVTDAARHVEKVDRLYLSTIETLAMAIDAKDQITHGHIRRVQRYAVGLARELGVRDESLIKAIEAAALLHDMGKLAIPEHILNKPGRLTDAEFETMKLHASVGADILSAIEFPYPVVPIVRHHHEAWDGSGYPDGLQGAEIPLGGRILAVVDCFDALRSDRPYRASLSDQEALRIVAQRSGSMYDPLVVETFARVHQRLEAAVAGDVRERLNPSVEIARVDAEDTLSHELQSFQGTESKDNEKVTEHNSSVASGPRTLMRLLVDHCRHLIPFDLCVFYQYEGSSDELVASHVADGSTRADPSGLRMALGHRISGWVGANRQAIMNSDAILDLGPMANTVSPRLKSCISLPIVKQGTLLGVLSLYSVADDPYSESHKRILETVLQLSGLCSHDDLLAGGDRHEQQTVATRDF